MVSICIHFIADQGGVPNGWRASYKKSDGGGQVEEGYGGAGPQIGHNRGWSEGNCILDIILRCCTVNVQIVWPYFATASKTESQTDSCMPKYI